MARKKRGRRAYATDLTDGQWALIAPLLPDAEPGGRPRKAPTRELVDAILYFLRAGMAASAARSAALADGLLLFAAGRAMETWVSQIGRVIGELLTATTLLTGGAYLTALATLI
jgi:Putative transposase of IS4/5 family (DUF4096)